VTAIAETSLRHFEFSWCDRFANFFILMLVVLEDLVIVDIGVSPFLLLRLFDSRPSSAPLLVLWASGRSIFVIVVNQFLPPSSMLFVYNVCNSCVLRLSSCL